MQPNDPTINDSSSQDISNQELPPQERSDSPDPSGMTPVETLQHRYADQLSQDIEQLESQKVQLREDIQTLTRAYSRLQASVESLRRAERSAHQAADAANQRVTEVLHLEVLNQESSREVPLSAESESSPAQSFHRESHSASEFVRPPVISSPRLPGEEPSTQAQTLSLTSQVADPPTEQTSERTLEQTFERTSEHPSIELPIPATSVQRRQLSIQSRRVEESNSSALEKRGLILSAIATVFMAWHFCAIATLGTGGSWLGLPIGALGIGFMPAVALVWLRMLVVVPALVLLAPQLHEEVWEDLQEWTYNRDGLLLMLIGSGIALFISQVLLYQCLGLLGPAIGAALLFLYPLTAVPLNGVLGGALGGHRSLSILGGVALVAIAMGGVLTLKPALQSTLQSASNTPSAIWIGLIASVAFSLYIALTNLSYRQPKCHPIPAGLVQFCVVAVLSSVVLLVQPLEPAAIDWLSFALWGIFLGFLMLLVYLFNYSSLRLIGPRTGMVAAIAPIVTLLFAWSFTPTPELATIQWTGIALVSIGGIALGKERADRS